MPALRGHNVAIFNSLGRTCEPLSELVCNSNSAPFHAGGALTSARNGDLWIAADKLGEPLLATPDDHLALQATEVALPQTFVKLQRAPLHFLLQDGGCLQLQRGVSANSELAPEL